MDFMTIFTLAMLGGQALGLFGGNDEEEALPSRTVETDKAGYQSPWLGLMDTLGADSMGRMLQAYAGAGFPGGVGFSSPLSTGVLEAIAAAGPELLAQYGAGGEPGSPISKKPGAGLGTKYKTKDKKGVIDTVSPGMVRPGYPPRRNA